MTDPSIRKILKNASKAYAIKENQNNFKNFTKLVQQIASMEKDIERCSQQI